MDQPNIPFDKMTGDRFIQAVKRFASSPESGPRAKTFFAGLVVLMLGINGMNVVNSYVGRDFMTAIADRNRADFIRLAWLYIGVFAASTLIAVISRFLEERLGLLWREFITRRAIAFYLAHGAYYRLNISNQLANPDQRIADDVRSFTATTLSFVLMIMNSSVTILFLVAVLYAVLGSLATIYLGKPLIPLNYDQLDKEANFRSSLIHVRENAESIRLTHREGRLSQRLLSRFDDLAGNMLKIISVNRNLSLFTVFYYWMIGIIPALLVAPDYMEGNIEFGVITQSAMAFSTLVGAFSLIVSQFQSISSFTAVIFRLHILSEALEPMAKGSDSALKIVEDRDRVAFDRVTLAAPTPGQSLVEKLNLSIPCSGRVLVSGPSEEAAVALFKAAAGLSIVGEGRIFRPNSSELLFLAKRPYLLPGTLRDLLIPTVQEGKITDEKLIGLLKALELESVLLRAGGLDKEQDWDALLSLEEQQLLAFIHILLAEPRFVFLDQPGVVLSARQVRQILNMLTESKAGYLHIDLEGEMSDGLYNGHLRIAEDGSWTWKIKTGAAWN